MTGARHSENKRRFQFHSNNSEISKGGQIVWKFPKKVEKSVEFPKTELFIRNVSQIPGKRFLNIFLYLESLSSFPETVPFVT